MTKLVYYEKERDHDAGRFAAGITSGCGAHIHSPVEILVVSRGEIAVTINGREKTLTAGDICISDSYDVHMYSPNENSVGYFFIIPKGYLREYSAATKNLSLETNFLLGTADVFCLVEKLAVTAYDEMQKVDGKEKKYNSLFFRGISSAVMGVLSSALPYRKDAVSDKTSLIRDVLLFIYANFADDINLNMLAKKFGYTPNHFSHIFNSYIGSGLKEFLNAVRAEKAASLMADGKNATEAAMESGFDSLRTFYRAFNKRYGVTPNRYASAQKSN